MIEIPMYEYISNLLAKHWAICWGQQPEGHYLYFIFDGYRLGIQHVSAWNQAKIEEICNSWPDDLPY